MTYMPLVHQTLLAGTTHNISAAKVAKKYFTRKRNFSNFSTGNTLPLKTGQSS